LTTIVRAFDATNHLKKAPIHCVKVKQSLMSIFWKSWVYLDHSISTDKIGRIVFQKVAESSLQIRGLKFPSLKLVLPPALHFLSSLSIQSAYGSNSQDLFQKFESDNTIWFCLLLLLETVVFRTLASRFIVSNPYGSEFSVFGWNRPGNLRITKFLKCRDLHNWAKVTDESLKIF